MCLYETLQAFDEPLILTILRYILRSKALFEEEGNGKREYGMKLGYVLFKINKKER